jgi:hypothetical protein
MSPQLYGVCCAAACCMTPRRVRVVCPYCLFVCLFGCNPRAYRAVRRECPSSLGATNMSTPTHRPRTQCSAPAPSLPGALPYSPPPCADVAARARGPSACNRALARWHARPPTRTRTTRTAPARARLRECACACVCVGGCSYGFFWLVVMSLIIGTLLGYLYLGLISVPTGLWKVTPVRVVLQRAPAAAAPGRACVRAARLSACARALRVENALERATAAVHLILHEIAPKEETVSHAITGTRRRAHAFARPTLNHPRPALHARETRERAVCGLARSAVADKSFAGRLSAHQVRKQASLPWSASFLSFSLFIMPSTRRRKPYTCRQPVSSLGASQTQRRRRIPPRPSKTQRVVALKPDTHQPGAPLWWRRPGAGGADAWACLWARVHWMTRGLRHWAVDHCTGRHAGALGHIAGKWDPMRRGTLPTDCDSVKCDKRGLSNSLMAHTIASSTCGPVHPGSNLMQTRKSPAPGRRPRDPDSRSRTKHGNEELSPGTRTCFPPIPAKRGTPQFPGKPGESGIRFPE